MRDAQRRPAAMTVLRRVAATCRDVPERNLLASSFLVTSRMWWRASRLRNAVQHAEETHSPESRTNWISRFCAEVPACAGTLIAYLAAG